MQRQTAILSENQMSRGLVRFAYPCFSHLQETPFLLCEALVFRFTLELDNLNLDQGMM